MKIKFEVEIGAGDYDDLNSVTLNFNYKDKQKPHTEIISIGDTSDKRPPKIIEASELPENPDEFENFKV